MKGSISGVKMDLTMLSLKRVRFQQLKNVWADCCQITSLGVNIYLRCLSFTL